jgi:multiple RNA-binding domain-containing protein 1
MLSQLLASHLASQQVIAQTKAALTDGGINVPALEAAAAASGAASARASVPRSATTLLVKNLPYSTDEDELRGLFGARGRTLVRLVLPPTRTLALVEFGEPQDAR